MGQAVATLLRHQTNISRQFLQAIHRHNSRFRNRDIIPVFLRRAAALISDYVLPKVRRQWDRFVVTLEKISCEKRNDELSIWDVFVSFKVYTCNDLDWTCTCLFATSHALPCQHIMFICRYGHGFEEMPTMTVSPRWNMTDTYRVYRQLEEGVLSLQSVTSSVTLRDRKSVV